MTEARPARPTAGGGRLRGRKRTLNTTDAAILLDLSPDEVAELARRARLRGRKRGHRWFFRLADLPLQPER